MTEREATTTGGASQAGTGVLTDEQRATFRSAGFWMGIIGWGEVLLGALAGEFWLLSAVGAVPREQGVAPSEWIFFALQVIGALVIGVLTLITARSFRRTGRDPAAGLPSVMAAVANLAELYERQVWLAFTLVAIAVGAAIAQWW